MVTFPRVPELERVAVGAAGQQMATERRKESQIDRHGSETERPGPAGSGCCTEPCTHLAVKGLPLRRCPFFKAHPAELSLICTGRVLTDRQSSCHGVYTVSH